MLIARSSRKDRRCWWIRTSALTRVTATDARTRGPSLATTLGKTRPLTRTRITRTPRCRTLPRKCQITRYRETPHGTPYPQPLILTHCRKNTPCIQFETWTHSVEQHQYRNRSNNRRHRPFLPHGDTPLQGIFNTSAVAFRHQSKNPWNSKSFRVSVFTKFNLGNSHFVFHTGNTQKDDSKQKMVLLWVICFCNQLKCKLKCTRNWEDPACSVKPSVSVLYTG